MSESTQDNSAIDLSILIISYNTREMTIACLDSVFEQTEGLNFEVIVLDNNSPDDSVEDIRENYPDIRLIARDDNLGFAGGNNEAAKFARGEYLLLLNPDTVVLDGAIQKLYQFAQEHPKAGIWGGKTLFGDGSLNPASCWRRSTLWSLICEVAGLRSMLKKSSLFNPEAYASWDREGDRSVDIVSGCFFLIPKNLWDELDGFHPDFFMYGEEADLCLRAKKMGYDPMVTSKATIIHYGGASEASPAGKLIKLMKSKSLLIDRHWSPLLAPIGRGLLRWSTFTRGLLKKFPGKLLLSDRSMDRAATWWTVWQARREWS